MSPLLADTGRRVVGTRQIVRAAAQGKLLCVYIAEDVDDKVRKQIEDACGAAHVPIEKAASMQELGQACRIAVGAAAAGILKESD